MSLFADIHVPHISSDELFAFHESHFAKVAVAEFGVSFIGLQVPPAPVGQDQEDEAGVDDYCEEYEYYEEEEYGDYDEPLDASVAHLVPDFAGIEAEVDSTTPAVADAISEKNTTINDRDDDAEDGEVPDEGDGLKPKKKKRRRKKNGAGNKPGGSRATGESYTDTAKQKPSANPRHERQGRPHKPDLRKRTWDVVDKGLGSLGYDDNDADPGSMPAPPQRRRIQYED